MAFQSIQDPRQHRGTRLERAYQERIRQRNDRFGGVSGSAGNAAGGIETGKNTAIYNYCCCCGHRWLFFWIHWRFVAVFRYYRFVF